MAKVSLRHVTKAFGEVQAVHDVNLEIEDQEFLVLVGPSGCGKSTTLRMIAGLEEISSGEIYIGDRLVNDVAPKDRDIAMVFQNYALYPHMNVYENMAFGLKLRHFTRQVIDNRVKETAGILGLTNLLGRKPKELSGGQRQRVALGRAIVRDPKVFLMDEPLSNLDAKLRVQTRTEISKLHNRLNATTIYVTHDQTEAMTMGDRIVVMKDGVVQQVAPPQELYDYPANTFVAGFIGSPAMNFLDVKVDDSNGHLRLTGDTFQIGLPEARSGLLKGQHGRPLKLGIRPEDIKADGAWLDVHPDSRVDVRVEVVEPMGAEVFLYVVNGKDHSFTARVDPAVKVRDQQTMVLGFDMDKCHLFDPETDLALR